MKEKVFAAILVVSILLILTVIGRQYAECKDSGGQLVRGVFWFTCIK